MDRETLEAAVANMTPEQLHDLFQWLDDSMRGHGWVWDYIDCWLAKREGLN